MSSENIRLEVLRHLDAINADAKQLDAVINDIKKVCFGKSPVPERQLLALFRKYDPKFAPISSSQERKDRAALSKKAQESIIGRTVRSLNPVPNDLKLPPGKTIERNHRILFREGTPEEKQKMADLVTSDDKKALGAYIHKRLTSKQDQLLALLDMDDEQLVENFFKHVDELDLIIEIQKYGEGYCEYTDEQKKDLEELYHKMTLLSGLYCRIDVIASPYYAKYPVEDLDMSAEASTLFRAELTALAGKHGEQVAKKIENGALVGGPASELAHDYNGLSSFIFGTLDQRMTDHVRAHNTTTDNCIWANESGTVKTYSHVIDALNDGRLIFANIPNVGIKAYYNADTSGLVRNCRPAEATPAVVQQHMLRSVQRVINQADAANPFFLSAFTGSAQYNAMEKQLKEVQQALRKMKDPMEAAKDPATMLAISNLAKSAETYLNYKKNQKLQVNEKTNTLIGRSANERKRLATAYAAKALYETLNFQIQSQADPKSAAHTLEEEKQKILDKRAAEKSQNLAKAKESESAGYAEQERCQTKKDDLMKKIQRYQDMPARQASDAGDAITNFQDEVRSGTRQLAVFAGGNRKFGANEGYGPILKQHMAKVILFDYVLREREANNGPQNTGPIKAGPVEQAMNRGFSASNLLASPAFKQFIGKLTPARIEAFLNNDESRSPICNEIVLGALAPAKTNAMSGQPTQPQQQLQQNTNQPAAKSKSNDGLR